MASYSALGSLMSLKSASLAARYSALVLNEDVIRALLEDEQLALVYLTLHPGYDAEIEPLHRPSWVLAQAKLEEEWLAEARRKLARARAALEVLV